jgi:putative DNA primase/helicase
MTSNGADTRDPHNEDAERAVLGVLILDGGRVPEMAELLAAEDFHSRRHQMLFECLVQLSNRDLPINFVSVGEALLAAGRFQTVGGNEYLVGLGDGVTSDAHLMYHGKIVAEYARLRLGIRRGTQLVADLQEARADDPQSIDALLEGHEQALRSLRGSERTAPGRGLVVRPFSTIERKPLRWLWPGRFPLGKLSLVCGNPKRGKSLFLVDVAARVSRGLGWPDAPDAQTEPRDVFILSAEDDAADTVRPRLEAAGADLDRVVWIDAVREKGKLRPINLEADLARMEHLLGARPSSALWIIDPLSAYLGARDSHKDSEIRGLLTPIAALAARTNVAIVSILHLRKGAADHAAYRVSGSVAFTAAARSSLLVAEDPDRPQRRLLLPLGGNLAPDAQGLAFAITASPFDSSVPVIAWEADPVSMTADEALAPRDQDDDDAEFRAPLPAEQFLCHELADGPVKAAELEERAGSAKLPWRTVQRAGERLRVESRRKGFGPGADYWWTLPPGHACHACHARHASDAPTRGADDGASPAGAMRAADQTLWKDGEHGADGVHAASSNAPTAGAPPGTYEH